MTAESPITDGMQQLFASCKAPLKEVFDVQRIMEQKMFALTRENNRLKSNLTHINSLAVANDIVGQDIGVGTTTFKSILHWSSPNRFDGPTTAPTQEEVDNHEIHLGVLKWCITTAPDLIMLKDATLETLMEAAADAMKRESGFELWSIYICIQQAFDKYAGSQMNGFINFLNELFDGGSTVQPPSLKPEEEKK
jgi:hypothetical protein